MSYALGQGNGNKLSLQCSKCSPLGKEQAEKLKNGEITKEEYDHWRYNYPKFNVLNSDKETANE